MKMIHSIFAATICLSALSSEAFVPSSFATKKWQQMGLNNYDCSEARTVLSWKPFKLAENDATLEGKVRDRMLEMPSFENLQSEFALNAQEALTPFAKTIDNLTNGWALSYADLSPESENTPLGQAFLATNIAYAVVGIVLGIHGDVLLGTLTEIASVASFFYHYTQLQASNNRIQDSSVRLALSIDYVCACTAILVGLVYLGLDHQMPPLEAVVSGSAGILCLSLGWVWEYGWRYLVTHSLWHLFSAYTAFVVGNAHLLT
ncbi:unnamed protein product [Cylindrotheca closterium]|uniref:Uncharacterized protein n=1 Tax=Cylindrotheca closterium TaxID=2856 RepID=A0AAD2G0B7_9STRA|nr:unnamed protein product [Cylindrotheca closterium]